jgi:hypothetical protein
MTYTGGSTVFAFDTIYRGPGPLFPGWWLKVGSRVYFASTAGFFMTDGTQVIPIGRDKADQYFLSRLDAGAFTSVQCGVDYINRLIYWTLPKSGDSGAPQEALVYNYEENRWTHVFDTVRVFVRGEESVIAQVGLQVFGNNSRVGTLTGTPGTAIFTTQEIRLNPAGKTLMSGLRPQIEGAVLANIAIKVGYRNNQTDAVTTTGAQTADTFTGAANFLIDARYHRAEFDITGAFTKASGGTFDAQPTSDY